MTPQRKKKVLVVGAGAAGMACADRLSRHPDAFDVTLVEPQGYCGGQMFSIPLKEERFRASFLNQGVQGGSHIYHHTFQMFKQEGMEASPVELQVSFGKDEHFWTNVFPTQLLQKHAKEIKRFKTAITFMKRTAPLWAILPIKLSLRIWGFSDEFKNFLIYPSLALFLGTGNYTPDIPSVLMFELYTNPTYGMWYPVDEQSLSSNLPPMVVFPSASEFYTKWQKSLEARGVHVRLNTEVASVLERSKTGVRVNIRPRRQQPDLHNPDGADQDMPLTEETYDEIVFCTLADVTKKLLGKHATWLERQVLGATTWSEDVTVTHNDTEYMKKWYTNQYDDKLAVSSLGDRDESKRIDFAKKSFKPMYYIKQVSADSKLVEMCFDCSNFQAQLKDQDIPFEDHVFQTIFLNKKDEHTWTKDEIRQDKIIRVDWWYQLCHTWKHYAFVVPFVFLLNRLSPRTTFAGSWTLLNAHEVAIISGVAAAYKLGASYPVELINDGFATICFRMYLLLSHAMWFSKKTAALRATPAEATTHRDL